MSDFYVSKYRTPTCNDHLPNEQADDAMCPYCEIELLRMDVKFWREFAKELFASNVAPDWLTEFKDTING